MARYRITQAAQRDIVLILARSDSEFGREARQRYESLIATGIRDAASRANDLGCKPRPELGEGVFSWHLSRSRSRSPGGRVRRPRHFLLCRRDGDILIVGRLLHDAMELREDVDVPGTWE